MRYIKSLQARLVVSYVLLSVLVLGITGLIFSAVFVSYAQQVHAARILQSYRQAAALVRETNAPPEQVRQRLQTFFPELDVVAVPVLVLRADGPPFPDEPEFRGLGLRGLGGGPRGEEGFRLSYRRPGIPLTEFRLTPRETWTVILQDLVPQMAAVSLSVLALAGLAGWWFSRRLSRPIGQLTAATARVAGGDLAQTVPPTGMMELDGLVEQFNRMSGALSESFRSLALERDTARRFAGDAAHELKTPLTALRGYNELALTRPERREQALAAAGRQIERLERIVGGLVRMARISEGGAAVVRADLAELVREWLPALHGQLEEAGLALTISLPDEPVAAGADPDLLAIALGNLVENACKFTRPGGAVTLSLVRADGEVQVSVADTGRGIPADELPHIFARFHRGLDTQAIPGSGLGLAVAAEAVARMGGRISVTSEPGQGSCFTIHLPVEDGSGRNLADHP